MMSGGMMRWVIVGVVALIAWMVSKNFDGPIVHLGVTALAAWIAFQQTSSMGGGMGG